MNSEDFIQADSEAGIGDGDFLFRTHRELFADIHSPGGRGTTNRDDGDRRNQDNLNASHVRELRFSIRLETQSSKTFVTSTLMPGITNDCKLSPLANTWPSR